MISWVRNIRKWTETRSAEQLFRIAEERSALANHRALEMLINADHTVLVIPTVIVYLLSYIRLHIHRNVFGIFRMKLNYVKSLL